MGKLQLKVRGEKLPNMDLFSKSDPYLCVYIARDNEEDYHFINRTEVKKDDLNPKWEELLLDHDDINQHNLQAKIKLEVHIFRYIYLYQIIPDMFQQCYNGLKPCVLLMIDHFNMPQTNNLGPRAIYQQSGIKFISESVVNCG